MYEIFENGDVKYINEYGKIEWMSLGINTEIENNPYRKSKIDYEYYDAWGSENRRSQLINEGKNPLYYEYNRNNVGEQEHPILTRIRQSLNMRYNVELYEYPIRSSDLNIYGYEEYYVLARTEIPNSPWDNNILFTCIDTGRYFEIYERAPKIWFY